MFQFTRETSVLINFVINDLLPPVLRDSRVFMWPMMKMAFGDKAEVFFSFRERFHQLSDAEYIQVYKDTESCNLLKGGDLNLACKDEIKKRIAGSSVLDVGCGRGELLDVLADFQVMGCDINPVPRDDVVYALGEKLPFADNSFDTVVCTHVIEHVRSVAAVMNELRRVAKRRVIVVVPRERPYKFGFNLHITFFPYQYSLYQILAPQEEATIDTGNFGGDWLYQEDLAG